MIEDKELHEAWDRIARTADGHVIYLHLQRALMAISADVDDGTLRRLEGERSFAAKLIGLMANGIEQSAAGLSTSCITFSVAGPRAVSRAGRGAARRITADTFVPGYDQPDARGPNGGGT